MIKISKLLISQKEKKAVLKVLSSGMLAQGPQVHKLEKAFALFCKAKYAVAVNSGTAAIHTALYSIGIKPGDEVITTPFTFVATANPILMCQATPVFVDVDERTFNLDPSKIEKAITKKTKAILVVNLYGQPANFKRIHAIARRHKLIVVEDAAQSVGSTYRGKKSGSLGHIACFSLYATKNITSGEGGIITTSNKKWWEKARLFRHHGQSEKKRYYYEGLGYNYRMTDIAAALALTQLKALQRLTKKRRSIARDYNRAFSKIKGLITPSVDPDVEHVYHQYTLQITPKYKLNRTQFINALKKRGIETNIYYPHPLHHFPHLKSKKRFPVAERLVRQIVSLPIHPLLSPKEVKHIIKTIQSL